MNKLSSDIYLRQNPDQLFAEANGEVLMMHIKTGEYNGLNMVASFIWHTLAEPQTVGAICEAVQTKFDVEESRCLTDVMAFLDDMIQDGLIDVVTAS